MFYTISLLKHCLFSNKLLNKTFNYLIKLQPLKHLCSMLPSWVNFQRWHWRTTTKRALQTETQALRSRVTQETRRWQAPPSRSLTLLTPPGPPQPLPQLPLRLPSPQLFSSPLFFFSFFCKASAIRPRKRRTKEAAFGCWLRAYLPGGDSMFRNPTSPRLL